MYEKPVVSFGELYHQKFEHRDIRTVKGLIRFFLQDLVRFFQRHVRHILQRDIAAVARHHILHDGSVLIRGREPQPKAAVTPDLKLDTFFQQTEIQLRLQGGHDAHAGDLLRFILPDPFIMHILCCCKGK